MGTDWQGSFVILHSSCCPSRMPGKPQVKPTSIWEAYLSQIMAEKAHVTSVHDVTGCFVSLQMTFFFWEVILPQRFGVSIR